MRPHRRAGRGWEAKLEGREESGNLPTGMGGVSMPSRTAGRGRKPSHRTGRGRKDFPKGQ